LPEDLTGMKSDTIKLARNKNWVKDLTKDIQLKEAAQVVDLMNTLK